MARSSVQNWFATELTSDVGSEALVFDATTTGDLSAPGYIVIRPRDEANREVIFCDVAFTDTRFETSDLSNRYLAGSAKSSGQTHPSGSEVWSVPLAQHLDDVWDLLETATSAATANAIVQRDGNGRAKVADGSAASDIATKGQLDNATTVVAARAEPSGSTSLSHDTATVIDLASEDFDTHDLHDNATNPSRMTFDRIGYWLAIGRVSFAANADGSRQARLHLNGTLARRQIVLAAGSTDRTNVVVVDVIEATSVGDYIELSAEQTSGGSLDALGGQPYETSLTVTFLGDS